MNCPHCDAERLKHPDGRLHCNNCGCCFVGNEMAPGHPICRDGSLPKEETPEPPKRTRRKAS